MRLILASIISAIVLFVWGFVFWQVLPFPRHVWVTAPDHDQYVPQMEQAITQSGVYLVPGGMDAVQRDPTFRERHVSGPLATIMYRKQGADPQHWRQFALGFLHMLGSAFVAGLVVLSSGRSTFFGRFMVMVWVGLFAAVWTQISKVVWFYYPWSYCWLEMAYILSGSLLMGLVMASILRPLVDETVG